MPAQLELRNTMAAPVSCDAVDQAISHILHGVHLNPEQMQVLPTVLHDQHWRTYVADHFCALRAPPNAKDDDADQLLNRLAMCSRLHTRKDLDAALRDIIMQPAHSIPATASSISISQPASAKRPARTASHDAPALPWSPAIKPPPPIRTPSRSACAPTPSRNGQLTLATVKTLTLPNVDRYLLCKYIQHRDTKRLERFASHEELNDLADDMNHVFKSGVDEATGEKYQPHDGPSYKVRLLRTAVVYGALSEVGVPTQPSSRQKSSSAQRKVNALESTSPSDVTKEPRRHESRPVARHNRTSRERSDANDATRAEEDPLHALEESDVEDELPSKPAEVARPKRTSLKRKTSPSPLESSAQSNVAKQPRFCGRFASKSTHNDPIAQAAFAKRRASGKFDLDRDVPHMLDGYTRPARPNSAEENLTIACRKCGTTRTDPLPRFDADDRYLKKSLRCEGCRATHRHNPIDTQFETICMESLRRAVRKANAENPEEPAAARQAALLQKDQSEEVDFDAADATQSEAQDLLPASTAAAKTDHTRPVGPSEAQDSLPDTTATAEIHYTRPADPEDIRETLVLVRCNKCKAERYDNDPTFRQSDGMYLTKQMTCRGTCVPTSGAIPGNRPRNAETMHESVDRPSCAYNKFEAKERNANRQPLPQLVNDKSNTAARPRQSDDQSGHSSEEGEGNTSGDRSREIMDSDAEAQSEGNDML